MGKDDPLPYHKELKSVFQQYGVNIDQFENITDDMYEVIQKLDLQSADESWGVLKAADTKFLRTGFLAYLIKNSSNYLIALNLTHIKNYESTTIYTDNHRCGEDKMNLEFRGGFEKSDLKPVLLRCKDLEELNMCSCIAPDFDEQDLYNVLHTSKSLRYLRLIGYRLNGKSLLGIRKPKIMEELHLIDCEVDNKYLMMALTQMTNLKILSLKWSKVWDDKYRSIEINVAKAVKRMNLHRISMFNMMLPLHLFQEDNMMNIKILCLDYMEKSITDDELKLIAHNCKNLVVISMVKCIKIRNDSFTEIIQLPKLKYINLSRTGVSEPVFLDISRELRVIICHSCLFSNQGFKILLNQENNIELLDVFDCYGVTTSLIEYLIEYMTRNPDHKLTVRIGQTAVDMDKIDRDTLPENLEIIEESDGSFDVDYRAYLN